MKFPAMTKARWMQLFWSCGAAILVLAEWADVFADAIGAVLGCGMAAICCPCPIPVARQTSSASRPVAGKLLPLELVEAAMDASLVSRNPEIMSGALCFAGTRVPVKNLFDYLEGASSLEDFLQDFPSVTRAKAIAVLEAARVRLTADAPAA